MPFEPSYIPVFFVKLFAYLPLTLLVAFTSIILGVLLSIVIAYIQYFRVKGANAAAAVFSSFIRGTPPIVQLFIWFYLLMNISSALGGSANPTLCAVIALGANCAVFMSDSFLTALLAVDPGQMDAAYSIGMSKFTALRKVMLPQALPIALPNLLNIGFIIFKESSIVFVIGVQEVVAGARMLSSSNFRLVEAFMAAALIFIPVCLILMLVMRVATVKVEGMRR